jgi:hypothetical protein
VLPYYCPTDPQTRQQTAAMIYNAILWMVAHPGQAPPVPVGQQFADVPATSPFAPAINALYAAGIVAGKPAPCEKP